MLFSLHGAGGGGEWPPLQLYFLLELVVVLGVFWVWP